MPEVVSARALAPSNTPELRIYSAILGRRPVIDPQLGLDQSRLRVSVHVDYRLQTMAYENPFVRPTVRERLEHWAARAAAKLDEARMRIHLAREQAKHPQPAPKGKPVVIIGPHVRARSTAPGMTRSAVQSAPRSPTQARSTVQSHVQPARRPSHVEAA